MNIFLRVLSVLFFFALNANAQESLCNVIRPVEPGVYHFYMTSTATNRYPNGMIEEGIRIIRNIDIGQVWESKGIKVYKDGKGVQRTETIESYQRVFRDLNGDVQMIKLGSAGGYGTAKLTMQEDGSMVYEGSSLSDLYGYFIKSKWIYSKIDNGYEVKVQYQDPKSQKWVVNRTMKLVKQGETSLDISLQ